MFSTTLIRKISELEPPVRGTILLLMEEMERERARWEESVTKTEFNELKEIVRELGKSVNELAEAQKRTEERLNQLAEAQEKTEERLNELAEAQKHTEERLNELAEAQKRTEEEIRKLMRGLSRTRRELGGLARSVAYALENEAYSYLPALLKKYHHLEVVDRFVRTA